MVFLMSLLLELGNTEYGELTYVMSSMRGGYIQSNYFSYKENSGLVGVVELKAGCKELSKIADAKYSQQVYFEIVNEIFQVCNFKALV